MKNNFYVIIGATQIALLGAIFCSFIGIKVPIFREVIGFLYLTFVPGFLILTLIRIKNFNFIEWVFYSINLSISFLMFIGLLMNTFYPLIGISKPISLLYLVITLTAAIMVLLIITFLKDRNNQNGIHFYQGNTNINLTQFFLLSLLPFLCIFGTYLLNYYNNNALLVILIVFISLIPFSVSSDRLQPNLYCFALFVIALSLLFHYSLVSGYINGYDIQIEKYFSNQVIIESFWDQNVTGNLNSLLSITILAPIYSLITSMDIVWVYKIIYPLIFAFISFGLYTLYCTQTNKKISFLSTFFFMSVFTFYVGMPQLARQEIGELFFVSLFCLIQNNKIDPIKKSFLYTVFIFSLVFSHYSLSYIFVFIILITWLTVHSLKKQISKISSNFFMMSFTFMIAWYIFTSDSSNIYVLLQFIKSVSSHFYEFLNPNYTQGLEVIKSNFDIAREITKLLHIASQLLITVGLIQIFYNKKSAILNADSKMFLVINYLICIASITVPYVSSSLNTMRLYHINLILLSPLFVIGGVTLIKTVISVTNLNTHYETKYYFLLSLFLSLFLVFNSGLVYEITGKEPNYISFNNSIDDAPRFTETEVTAVNWISVKESPNITVYGDEYMRLLLSGITGKYNFFGKTEGIFFFVSNDELKSKLQEDAYIFLGERNVKRDKLYVHLFKFSLPGENAESLKASGLQETLSYANLIRNDGFTNIYLVN